MVSLLTPGRRIDALAGRRVRIYRAGGSGGAERRGWRSGMAARSALQTKHEGNGEHFIRDLGGDGGGLTRDAWPALSLST